MKKYFNKLSILLAAAGFSLTACDSLNLVPQDFPASTNFWNSEPQVKGEMYGMHKQLKDQYINFWLIGEARSSTQRYGTSTLVTSINYQEIKANTLSTDTPASSNWFGFYRPIMELNLFIEKVTPMGEDIMTAAQKNAYLGQAYGMRAYYYFHLLRTYGGVPIETKASVMEGSQNVTDYYTPRSSYDETLKFIKDDVNKSDAFFAQVAYAGTGAAREMWNKAATKVLKAEVYLWGAKYLKASYNVEDLNTAMTTLQEIPTTYGLMDKYLDVFSYDNKGNKEIILSLNFSIATGNSAFANDFVYAGTDLSANACVGVDQKAFPTDTLNLKKAGWQRNEFSYKFFEAYDDADLRKRGNFMDIYKKDAFDPAVGKKRSNTGTILRKYLGTIDGSNRKFVDDFIIYRYTDVLLIMAEIKNALGQDPSTEMNAIRQRAYGMGNPFPAFVNGDFSANEKAIYLEYAKEAPCEAKMWYNVIRMQQTKGGDPLVYSSDVCFYEEDGRTVILDKETQSYMLLWPIARALTTTNPLITYNPGYIVF